MCKFYCLIIMILALGANAHAQMLEAEDDSFVSEMLKASEAFQKKQNAASTPFILYFRDVQTPVRLNDVEIIDGIEDYELNVTFDLQEYYKFSDKEKTSKEINNSSHYVAYKGNTYYINEIRILDDFKILFVVRPFTDQSPEEWE